MGPKWRWSRSRRWEVKTYSGDRSSTDDSDGRSEVATAVLEGMGMVYQQVVVPIPAGAIGAEAVEP